jgi:hypothetical protein
MAEDTLVKLVAAAVNLGIGLFLIALSLPFVLRKVKPNPWWGFIRTRRMVENADVWYPVNAYAARVMITAVGVYLLLSLIMLVPFVPPEVYVLVLSGLLVVIMIVVVVMSLMYLRRFS